MKPLYGGIDLHANNSVIVVLDEEDQIVYRKRLPNDLEHILLQLAPYRAQLQGLVVESTFKVWGQVLQCYPGSGLAMTHPAYPSSEFQYLNIPLVCVKSRMQDFLKENVLLHDLTPCAGVSTYL